MARRRKCSYDSLISRLDAIDVERRNLILVILDFLLRIVEPAEKKDASRRDEEPHP